MNLTLAYLGRSGLQGGLRSGLLNLVPNLTREPVAFDAALRQPVRFREAISALHDIVISDLRPARRDRAAYEEWKAAQRSRAAALDRAEHDRIRKEILTQRETVPPPELVREYEAARGRYWKARDRYSRYLFWHEPGLWRRLMPCDPIVTVAEDVVFFECFSADESSYGCLTVDRAAGFGRSDEMRPGTTNVDYSWELYRHFQTLRTYRQTRLRVDPAGFEVATRGSGQYREEKIDLPPGWLRGLMQIQAAMTLPLRRVALSREAVYSLVAWLRRHREKTGPRAIRFELLNGRSPTLVLEPWEQPITSHGTQYDGPDGEPVRLWGRRRLAALARVLPLVERVDVYLLGTGLPSFWVARMGAMRLTLGLSGWTANDWTRGSALDLLTPPADPPAELVRRLAALLQQRRAEAFSALQAQTMSSPANCAAALRHLAQTGQVIYDLAAGVYRWRQILPQALGEAEIGPENLELAAARRLLEDRRVTLGKDDATTNGRQLAGQVEGKPVELTLDPDGGLRRGKCVCAHHRAFGLRRGPCRHLLALRQFAHDRTPRPQQTGEWFDRLRRWANN